MLEIRQQPNSWQVVYGGFSRGTGVTLAAALAEATGLQASAFWIRALVAEIEPLQ